MRIICAQCGKVETDVEPITGVPYFCPRCAARTRGEELSAQS